MCDIKNREAFPLRTFKKRACPYIEKEKPFHMLHLYIFQNLAINI